MKKIAIASIIFFSVVSLSCEKNELSVAESQNTQQINKIEVKNGRLVFVDEKHFNETLNYLESNQSEEFLDNWEKQFSNFISSRKMFNSITEKDIEKIAKSKTLGVYEDYLTLIPDYDGEDRIATKQIPTNAIGTLFNKEGLVLVGNDAYKYTLDRLVKFTDFDENELNKFKNNISSSKVSFTPIVKGNLSSKNLRTSEISNAEHCTTYIASNERFAADYNLYKCNGLFTCAIGDNQFRKYSTTAMFQKRFLGIWSTSTPYKIKKETRQNNGFILTVGPYTNYSSVLENGLSSLSNIYISQMWVRVTGQKNASNPESTCTCGQ